MPISRLHAQIAGIDAFVLAPPGGLDNPLRVARGHVAEIGALDPMHRNAAPARDKAGDGVGRHRLAATAQLRQQFVHADHQNLPAAARLGLGDMRLDLGFGFGRCHFAAQGDLDRPHAHLAARGGQEQIIGMLEAELVRQVFVIGLGRAVTLQFTQHEGASVRQHLRFLLGGKPGLDLRPRARGRQIALRRRQPVARRPTALGDGDLDLLTALQGGVERHQMAVNLRATAAVPQIGMYAIGEVNRCRALRQVDDAALRRHDIDGVVERGALELLDPVCRVGDLVAPRQELPQPGNLVVIRRIGPGRRAAFLVAPVGGDAHLGVPVHLLGANLHFKRPAVLGQHGSMQGAVMVALRMRNVIVEFAVNRLPQRMHDTQCRIAIAHLVKNDAQRPHVINFGELDILLAHLVPDAVNVLGAAIDLHVRDTGFRQFFLQPCHRRGDERLTLQALLVEHPGDALVGRRLGEAE